MSGFQIHPASFRDPSGFIFRHEGKFFRQVNKVYKEEYDHFIQSGLYTLLADKNLLLPHREINENLTGSDNFSLTLLPEQIDLISYPYEWSFEQLRDAALLTLEITALAIEKGMILKDATPFNIQFLRGKPVFIDTLSFEKYDETKPWVAYRQFCECFLFPLFLGKYTGIGFQKMLSIYPDGIPVAVTASLLPFKSRFNASVWLNVFLQNRMSKKDSLKPVPAFSKIKMTNLVRHLHAVITSLNMQTESGWSNYYDETILNKSYLAEKENIISRMLDLAGGKNLLDVGANDGYFSFLAAKKQFSVTAVDADEGCINRLYIKTKKESVSNILPLCIDITNPTPDIGFANEERHAFTKRIKPDIVLALALIHHLAIGKNIPVDAIAAFLNSIASQLIIEFVPKEDEKIKQLLRHKKDIYAGYSEETFESCFKKYFSIEKKEQVAGTGRIIYLMKRMNS